MHRAVPLALVVVLFASRSLAQTVVGTITRAGFQPRAVAVYEPANRVFVSDAATSKLFMYDGTTLAELAATDLGFAGHSIAVHQTLGKVFVGSFGAPHKVAVLDASSGAFIMQLAGSYTNVTNFAVDESAGKVWAISHVDGLRRIDVATLAETFVPGVSGGTFCGCGPAPDHQIAVNPITHELFVAETESSSLKIVNANTLGVTTIADVRGHEVVVNAQENKAYVIGSTVYAHDRDTGVTTPLDFTIEGLAVVDDPVRNRFVSTTTLSGKTTIFSGNTDTGSTFPMQPASTSAGIRHATGHVYFVGRTHVTMLDVESEVPERIAVPAPESAGTLNTGIAINQTTGRLFAINDQSYPHVTVIDDTPLPARPPLFVSELPFAVHMVDPITMAPAGVEYSTGHLGAIAVRPGGGRLYNPARFDGLEVFAGTSFFYSKLATYAADDDGMVAVAATPDATRLYAVSDAVFGNRKVHVLEADDGAVVTSFDVQQGASAIAITPDGAKVLVANTSSNSVSVASTATNAVLTTLAAGSLPLDVVVHPASRTAYVSLAGAGSVRAIDLATHALGAPIDTAVSPGSMAFSADGKKLFVVNDASVSVIDSGTNTVIATIPIATGDPRGIAAKTDNSGMYLVVAPPSGNSSLVVIDMSTYALTPHTLPWDDASHVAVTDLTARIAGRVTSSLGGVVAGATVRALQSDVQRGITTTNAAGDYAIPNLAPGTYDVEIVKSTFVTSRTSGHAAARGRIALHSAVLQSLCVADVAPAFASHAAAASGGAINLSMLAGCAWSASTPPGSFVTLTGATSGSGSATIAYNVAENATSLARSTTITIGSATVTITQNASTAGTIALDAMAGAAQVSLTWSAAAGASGYQVHRSSGGGAFALLATAGSTAFNDFAVSSGNAYLYRVQAMSGANVIAYSNVDLAVVFNFADALATGVTPVRALHLAQLRQSVNAASAALARPSVVFTDASLAAAPVRRIHLVELRAAIDRLRAAAGMAPLAYADPVLTAGVTRVRAGHVTDLRNSLR